MALPHDNRGQLYTIEGIIASLILIGVLLFIIQANSVIIPQTEKISDMKLQQRANDILNCVEISNGSNNANDLKTYVELWNGSPADPAVNEGVAGGSMKNIAGETITLHNFDNAVSSRLSGGEQYSVSVSYNDTSLHTDIPLIIKGQPGDNSVVATRLVTLYPEDDAQLSEFWRNNERHTSNLPIVVDVKIICWHL
jgi:hypothetical protein